ncbi:MAG: hypothetical protein RBR68_00010 [Tenuifilaceae bacterium]|jgi:hypothetical protein|nr:hypothetical protein [Tenuifilaceae bacterium]
MGKKLCQKDIKHKDEIEAKKYSCKKCGVSSNKEKKLCKPVER